MNEQADAIDAKLDAYTFELNDEWDGPGDYGFALAGPDLREGFGEVSVDETITVKLAVDENDDEYTMALVPDVRRSLDRFLLARSLISGVDVPPSDDVRVVFQPLVFRGPKSKVSRRALPLLRDEVTVGFLDVRELSAGLDRLDPRSAGSVGPLRLERDRGLLSRT